MIRPSSEIEYPPSSAQTMRARMLVRMEALSTSNDALMSVIAKRIGAEKIEDDVQISHLSQETERLIENMRNLIRKEVVTGSI
ncbi:MAG: hypothetical protein COB78_10520 [Hyphomicrobiales bacterium]|nr:MAG: hypothetical protein COB78_10520 [Hyphomicrobiales bacterium]